MYISTRDNSDRKTAAEVIRLGMVPAGGLFVPETIPLLSAGDFTALKGASYQEVAEKILSLYLDGFSRTEIRDCLKKAYNDCQFDHAAIAPLTHLKEKTYVLELWHGPTAAFKDMALQVMPHLLGLSLKKTESQKETVILVATSGDTGKAALEGFKNIPGISIIVFYPAGGVSKVQELQMVTTEGDNTHVVAVKGNFDDCQNAVKAIFADGSFQRAFSTRGYELSSANSINWGRLLPQIVYYLYAYLQLLDMKAVKKEEKVNFVVPTGNFGNILAGWYAGRMGVPVHRLLCASNENRVLTDFFRTGIYNRNREFKQTNSPSMDILISSNLERFLFEITGHDGQRINKWMQELNSEGVFTVDKATKAEIEAILAAGFANEDETLETIRTVYRETGYVLDTHTAVGINVYEKYLQETGDQTVTVVTATASPYKFNSSVLEALEGPGVLQGKDEFQVLDALSQSTGLPVHPALKDLERRIRRHNRVCEKEEVGTVIKNILGI